MILVIVDLQVKARLHRHINKPGSYVFRLSCTRYQTLDTVSCIRCTLYTVQGAPGICTTCTRYTSEPGSYQHSDKAESCVWKLLTSLCFSKPTFSGLVSGPLVMWRGMETSCRQFLRWLHSMEWILKLNRLSDFLDCFRTSPCAKPCWMAIGKDCKFIIYIRV